MSGQGRFNLLYKVAKQKEDKTFVYEQVSIPLSTVDLNEMSSEASSKWMEILDNFKQDKNNNLDFAPKDPIISYDGVAFANLN